MTTWKLTGQMSCAKCKYMYVEDSGYSNYTVEHTSVHCALNKNPKIPTEHGVDMPHDWSIYKDGEDPWHVTNQSRCEMYDPVGFHDPICHLDVDGEVTPHDKEYEHLGREVIDTIARHSGRFKPPPADPVIEPTKEELMAESVRLRNRCLK